MLPPPAAKTVRSAPPSCMPSPVVSPHQPLSLCPHPNAVIPPAGPIYSLPSGPSSSVSSGLYLPRPASDISLLTAAASHIERGAARSHPQPAYYTHSYQSYSPAPPSVVNSPSTPAPLDDHYSHAYRQPKRSRPNSPNSTAPSSPTFSHDSLSPTPDHTPVPTPSHSPRLRPINHFELPALRSLSLHPNGTLGPQLPLLEPSLDSYQSHLPAAPVPGAALSAPRTAGMSLLDIINRPDRSPRKLPLPVSTSVPRMAVQDLLSGPF